MMELNALVAPMTRTVSPSTAATLRASTGYQTAADGSRTPGYAADQGITIDVQALTSSQLTHMDSLNIQGTLRAVWSDQGLHAVDRVSGRGGDILLFDDGDGAASWLVVHIIETWNGAWCHVVVQKQVQP
jgi:hypothetical protein